MDFSKNGTLQKQKEISSVDKKLSTKWNVIFFRIGIVFFIGLVIISIFLLAGFLKGLIDTSPKVTRIDVEPNKYKTTIYDDSNKDITQVLVGEESNREYVTIDKIPKHVQDAFIDIEDERFYEHNGIDVRGVFRATFVGLSNGFSEGASTLTQQLIKNCVFKGGMETSISAKVERKIQEQYLAVQLEKKLDKKSILENYLNTINLGAGTYGVETACKRYFNKSVSNISISEATVIASITKNPVGLNPITHPEENSQRRQKVLKNMLNNNHISQKEYDKAINDDIYEQITSVDSQYEPETSVNSYFVDALYMQVKEDLMSELNYSESKAVALINSGGLNIYSTQNMDMQKICDEELSNPDNYPFDVEYKLTYNISVLSPEGKMINKSEGHMKMYFRDEKGIDDYTNLFTNKNDANHYIEEYKKHLLSDGSTFVADNKSFSIQPQTSFVLMDQQTGQVKALVGGRGEKKVNLALNRATNSTRQPGSTFKVLSTFLPALDTGKKTLASVQDDTEYYYPDNPKKQVRSWEGDNYHGLVSMRYSIEQSNNVTTVKTLDDISVNTALDYLGSNHLNFSSLVTDSNEEHNDTHTAIALGGLTNGVTNEELTAAYASIANGGTYIKPSYYTKVTDRNGTILLEKSTKGKRIMKETTSWLLTDAMKGVVSSGTGRVIGSNFSRSAVAGKTGTTSDSYDLWFAGYTPYYTASIWLGFDENKTLQTSSSHEYTWAKIMQKIQENLPYKEFKRPNGIDGAKICTKCGKLANSNCADAIGGDCTRTEYFAEGTIPSETCTCHKKVSVCDVSGHIASSNCKNTSEKVYLIKDEENGTYTDDSDKILPSSLQSECTSCDGNSSNNDDDDDKKEKNEEEQAEIDTQNKPEVSDENFSATIKDSLKNKLKNKSKNTKSTSKKKK